MRRNNLFTKFIVSLALVALLLSGSRVMSAFALSQEITPELEPVYDTEVISLQDYVDNVLTDAQVAVFNTILGSYVASQAGLNEYDLEYPYNGRPGVIGWLQDAGLKLYNAIITGGSFDLVTGTDLRTYIITAASYAIGMAQKAHTYTDMNDFLDDVDNSTHYFVPIDPVLQASINSYFGRDYGLWNWQFSDSPFISTSTPFTVDYSDPTKKALYEQSFNNLIAPRILFHKLNNYSPYIYGCDYIDLNLFIDITNNQIYLVNNNGVYTSGFNVNSAVIINDVPQNSTEYINCEIINSIPDFPTYKEVVQEVFNKPETYRLLTFRSRLGVHASAILNQNYVKHIYVGENWATKQEIFNIQGLNFQKNDSPSYNQVPDNSYIDLKGFLTDIVNNTNILNVILNNLFKPDGTLNIDPALVKVSITIPDTNPLPVNLNEIDSYTHNEYLTLIKEHATNFGETIGEYVAFWHNSDAELTYTILGSFIIIMIGAFIGKWGHS